MGKTCIRCVMDESDSEIKFSPDGTCNHCAKHDSDKLIYAQKYSSGGIDQFISNMKAKNKNNTYDCVIGVSGGKDSSYLLHKAVKDWKLRVLAVHVDAGWNSEVAVANIEKLVSKLGVRLHTVVIDWKEMKLLQRAFLKAHLLNQDTPQDHAFFAGLYGFAVKNNVNDVLSGHNFSSESVMPSSWGYNPMDGAQLKDVMDKHGEGKLKKFPVVSFWQLVFGYPYINKMKVHNPLNYLDYKVSDSVDELLAEYGWTNYKWKHYESRFTMFYEGSYLVKKYGIDKRKAHLSSLIWSGQISREDALKILSNPPLNVKEEAEITEYVAMKLGFSSDEMKSLLMGESKSHLDYKNNLGKINFFRNVKKLLT